MALFGAIINRANFFNVVKNISYTFFTRLAVSRFDLELTCA